MKISVSASYAATDGSVPKNLTVEVEMEDQGADTGAVAGSLIRDVLAAVHLIPETRYAAAETPDPVGILREATTNTLAHAPDFKPASGAGPGVCLHIACGHPRGAHADLDANGIDQGAGGGACGTCRDPLLCASFVPARPPAIKEFT